MRPVLLASQCCLSISGSLRWLFPHNTRPPTHLELFKLPSSEAALDNPLFFDNQDLTPSTRSSSSESTSESPSLSGGESRKVGKVGWEVSPGCSGGRAAGGQGHKRAGAGGMHVVRWGENEKLGEHIIPRSLPCSVGHMVGAPNDKQPTTQ